MINRTMREDDYYQIKDFDAFVKETKRIAVENFKNFTEEEEALEEDYDEVTNKVAAEFTEITNKINNFDLNNFNENEIVSDQECEVIIRPFLQKENGKEILSDSIYFEILRSIHTRIVSNMLTILSSKGIIESAFDEELDDFVFWISEENEE